MGICALMFAGLKVLRGREVGVVKTMGIEMTEISQDEADGIVERMQDLCVEHGFEDVHCDIIG